MRPAAGRHRWSPPKRSTPRITRKTALIVTGIGLLAGVSAGVAALRDTPESHRAVLDAVDGAPDTLVPIEPFPTPTLEPTPSAASAPDPTAATSSTSPTATATWNRPRQVRVPEADRRYDTCEQVIAAGLGPYRKGRDVEYHWYPDDDHDGWVCKRTPKRPDQVRYRNCDEVRAAGAAPLYRDDPGYGRHLDRDGDGVACE